MRRTLPLLAAAVLVFLASEARAAKEPEVKISVQAGLGGTMGRAGVWTPVFVDLENQGPAVDGIVVVRYEEDGGAKGTMQQPVELASGARKRVVLYARPRAGPSTAKVTFEDRKGDILAGPEDGPLSTADDDTVIVGVVNMGATSDVGLRPLFAGRAQTKLVMLDADELPDAWASLRVLDVLMLREPDTSKLGPDRIAAIKTWVSGGGTLVVTSGEKWRAMDDPTFTELLPVQVSGVRTISANQLPPPFYLQGSEVAMAAATPLRGRTVMSAGNAPLVSEARYGLGRVLFLAVDPGALTNVSVAEKGPLWKVLLDLPREQLPDPNAAYGGYGYTSYASPEQMLQQELSKIPPLKPPSVILVTLLIALYVAVVGPGDYFLLKRIHKLHWTWVTYPAAIAAFSGLIYLYARLTRSSEMMVRTISLIDVPSEPSGAPEPVHVYGGVYSPRAGRYTVDIKPAEALAGSFTQNGSIGLSTAASEYASVSGKHPSVLLSIPIWSMAGVDFLSVVHDPPPFVVNVLSGGAIEITNTSTLTLEYVGVLYNGKVIDGGRLEPGKSVKLSRNNAGSLVSEVQQQVNGGDPSAVQAGSQDVTRIVRVFAYATDPPYADASSDPYYALHPKRRTGALERPRRDQGQPLVFAVARSADLPIEVPSERNAASGLTVWRAPVLGAGWPVKKRVVNPIPIPTDTYPDDDDYDNP